MSAPWSRQAVLSLYKTLMRRGASLQFTDRDFYRRAIQKEFRKHMQETNEADKQRHLERGNYFLRKKLGGLV